MTAAFDYLLNQKRFSFVIKSLTILYFAVMFLFAGLSPAVSETVILLICGYTGILTHYVKKWSDKVDKSEKMDIPKTVPSIILSFITTTVLILLRADVVNLYVFTKMSSFIAGYFGNSWFFGFIEKKMSSLNPQNNIENETSKN